MACGEPYPYRYYGPSPSTWDVNSNNYVSWNTRVIYTFPDPNGDISYTLTPNGWVSDDLAINLRQEAEVEPPPEPEEIPEPPPMRSLVRDSIARFRSLRPSAVSN